MAEEFIGQCALCGGSMGSFDSIAHCPGAETSHLHCYIDHVVPDKAKLQADISALEAVHENWRHSYFEATAERYKAESAFRALHRKKEQMREALEIDPYSEQWGEIVEQGYHEYRKSRGGYRGQLITPMDAPEYWVCKAFASAVLKETGND